MFIECDVTNTELQLAITSVIFLSLKTEIIKIIMLIIAILRLKQKINLTIQLILEKYNSSEYHSKGIHLTLAKESQQTQVCLSYGLLPI